MSSKDPKYYYINRCMFLCGPKCFCPIIILLFYFMPLYMFQCVLKCFVLSVYYYMKLYIFQCGQNCFILSSFTTFICVCSCVDRMLLLFVVVVVVVVVVWLCLIKINSPKIEMFLFV